MTFSKSILVSLAVVLFPVAAQASLDASGSFSWTQVGSTYTYNGILNDIGTTTVGTFWYSWIPGEDFLPSLPTAIASPTGWTATTTHAGPSDGYAIEWVASSPMAAGTSLSGFKFSTTASPTQLSGKSTFYPTQNVGTSFVYSQGPFSDGGKQILVNPVPEPASIGAFSVGLLMLRRRRRK